MEDREAGRVSALLCEGDGRSQTAITSTWAWRRVRGSTSVRAADTRLHSTSGPRLPRLAASFAGKHTRSSCTPPAVC